MKKMTALFAAAALCLSLTACGSESISSLVMKDTSQESETAAAEASQTISESTKGTEEETKEAASESENPDSLTDAESIAALMEEVGAEEQQETAVEQQTEEETAQSVMVSEANVTSDGAIDASELFTDRDLRQTADTSGATVITLSDNQELNITEEGVYVLSGTASEVTVTVETTDDAKVQIVLDGVNITNSDSPFIYVKNADKVFVTTTSPENSIVVNGTFTADGEISTDAAIFSKDDLVMNGTGSLYIYSSDNGISCKDDLKITGGTITIECASDALEANDSVAISDGTITITTNKDGIHAENDEDNTTGYIYICGGTLTISAADDAIHATTIVQVDSGNLILDGSEAIEATWVQINDGNIQISASDDGINASYKSSICTPVVEINGGDLTINMGQGDTDGIDSNGDLSINGGTISITGQSPFDYDGTAQYNGGTLIVNGQETTSIANQFGGMGGGMRGPGGQDSGWGNDAGWGSDSGWGEGFGNGFGGPGGGRGF